MSRLKPSGPAGFRLSTTKGRTPRILLLGAHSDDIEIGCGGTVLSMLAAQPEIECRWIVFSGNVVRRAEAERSARRFLRRATQSSVTTLDFRESYFPSEVASIKDFFEQLKEERSPDLIFTHRREDQHQDHRVISELTWNTFRSHCVLEYEVPKYEGDLGHPNFFVPLAKRVAKAKVRGLMEGFASQHARNWFTPDTFLGLMRIRGMESGAPAGMAEAFHARKIVFEP